MKQVPAVLKTLVTDTNIGAVNSTWVDCGGVMNVEDYDAILVAVQYEANDSEGFELQLLPKLTLADEVEFVLESTADYQKLVGDSDINVIYTFYPRGISYVQLQTRATTVGATPGTVTIKYRRV